jgi:hypothetical protein
MLFLSDGRMPYVIDCADNSFFAVLINTDSQIKIIGRNVHYPNSANKIKTYEICDGISFK